MERLFDDQLNQLKGGGYWYEIAPGKWIYVDDDESDSDDEAFM